MKKVYIISLHLAFGGIEKAICNMANVFAERYDTEILCVYDMPGGPAFPLDSRVKVRYLLRDIPNREQWHDALRRRNIAALIRESFRGLKIYAGKKLAVIKAIRGIREGAVITTRHEDNLLLSTFGRRGVLKIAQIHHDHRFDKKLVRGFKRGYGNIDILAMLTPSLRDEVKAMMQGHNKHTRVEYVPNFLIHYPENVSLEGREEVIVSVGRLNAVKRFDLLIREFTAIMDRLPGWQLRIVGEGEERPHLEKLITDAGAGDRIVLTGMKDAQGVEEEMLRASVYAMTSESEGFPFVLIEAESCGLPLLAFDVRVGPGHMIHDGQNGFLAPEGDTELFRQRLLSLAADSGLRRQMGQAGLECAREFSREELAKLWYSLLGD